MMLPPLAHGALGIYDEVVFILVIAIFIGLMGVSWVRGRMSDFEPDEPPADAAAKPTGDPDSSGRFTLD